MNDDSNAKRRDDDALAAEYALGVLPHGERVAFARRLEDDAALRERVRFWDEHFASLSEQVEPVAPPARIREQLERSLFANTAPRAGWWESTGFWRGLSLASLAAFAVVSVLYVTAPVPVPVPDAAPNYVTALSGETGAVRLVAFYDGQAGVLKLNRTEGAPQPGRAFELWLIEGSNAPVSLGLLPDTATGSLPVPDALKAKFANAVLAISDEPPGGSPTGQPTGAVLATGKVASI